MRMDPVGLFSKILLLLLTLPSPHLRAADTTCVSGLSEKVFLHQSFLREAYKKISPQGPGIKTGAEPQFLPGDKEEAIVLVHGFIASPFEVQELAQALHKEGRTVYMPLIYGFGSDGAVANQATLHDWKKSVKDAVQLVHTCYEKISLIGFSLGGGLSADFVLKENPSYITSLVLMAPYFRPASKFGSLLNSFLNFFMSEVSLEELFVLSSHPDLVIPLKYPGFYNETMPLQAVETILELKTEFEKLPSMEKSKIPMLLAYSEADQTVDFKYASELVTSHFTHTHFRVSHLEENIPHQVAVSSPQNQPEALFEDIIRFLNDKF